jgi:hypothetical protein
MLPFLLAGIIVAGGQAEPVVSLAGVSLGDTLQKIRSEHPDAEVRQNGAGSRLTWKRQAGGNVTVLFDNSGTVVNVFLTADRGETDSIDLPCANNFPVRDSHADLDTAMSRNTCAFIGENKYRLHDGSILETEFGAGQLQQVGWFSPREENADWVPTQVNVSVFECLHDTSAVPELRIWDIDRIFDADSITPHWTFEDPMWTTTVSLPAGHYILHATTQRCAGESEQLVTILNHARQVTITLDDVHDVHPKSFIVRLDENMYASAVYGVLPSPAAQVEIMSADDITGEQTRQSAKIDGSIYEVDHLRPGHYIVRVHFGEVTVSREVSIPQDEYGAVVRADLTPKDASQIVQTQAAGNHFATVGNYMHESITTLRHGSAIVDGWTNELISPADYTLGAQRISAPIARALDVAESFLRSDARIPRGFRTLSAWSLQVEQGGHHQEILINLLPTDQPMWLRDGPKTPEKCYVRDWEHYVRLAINDTTWNVDQVIICP